MMMRNLDYLFYQVYNLFNHKYLFHGLSKMKYRAAGFISAALYLNFVTILNWMNYRLFGSEVKMLPIIFAVFFVIMGISYFTREKKLQSIIKQHKHDSPRDRYAGLIILLSYIFISLLLFIISL